MAHQIPRVAAAHHNGIGRLDGFRLIFKPMYRFYSHSELLETAVQFGFVVIETERDGGVRNENYVLALADEFHNLVFRIFQKRLAGHCRIAYQKKIHIYL